MNSYKMRLISSSLLTLASVSGLAQAQGPSRALEEVVVTATKRGSVALQSVPSSIAALDQSAINRMGAVSVEDLTRAIPALDTIDTGPGQKQYLIRGIYAEGESTVAVLLDNVPLVGGGDSSRNAGANIPDFDLYDIQQVAVLRGPQGTLYGANSVAGVVRYETNKPSFDGTDFEVRTGASSISNGENSWELKSLLNAVAIEDVLALRGTVSYSDNGGYIDNVPLGMKDINANERLNARLSALWNLSDTTRLTAQYFYQDIDAEGRTSHAPYDWAENIGPPFMLGGNHFEQAAAGELKSNTPIQEPYTEGSDTYALTLESDLRWGDLTVAGSYVDRKQTIVLDSSTPWMLHKRFQETGEFLRENDDARCGPPLFPEDCIPMIPPFESFSDPETVISPTGRVILAQDQRQEAVNFEARFASDFEGSLNFLAGVFYQNRDMQLESSRLWAGDPVTGLAMKDGPLMLDRSSSVETKQKAVFGELYWDITETVELTLGARYFKTEQALDQTVIVPFLVNPAIGGEPGRSQFDEGENDSIFKVNLAWHASDDIMLYGDVSEGFRSGGVNNRVVEIVPVFYGSDKTTNYEAGIKSTWLDGALQLNFSAYHIDWEDLQVGVDFTDQFGGLVNADGEVAEVDGFELELLYMPLDWLTLGFNYADIDARLTADLADAIPSEVVEGANNPPAGKEGDSLRGSPEYSGSAFAMFDFNIAGMESYVRADVQFQSEVPNNNYHEVRNIPSRSYELINLRMGLRQNEHWNYAIYVKNLTNEIADLTIYNNFQQNNRTTPAAPRTVGFELQYAL